MRRDAVISAVIISVGYSELIKILEIEFIDHNVYQYVDVPKDIYHSLMISDSQGKYFNNYIKDQYNYIRIK